MTAAVESTARSEVSAVDDGGDLPNHSVRARFRAPGGRGDDGGPDGGLGMARGGVYRRRRRISTAVRVRAFRGLERERKGARGYAWGRRRWASPRRPYPRPKQAGAGGRRRLRPARLLARGGRRQKRGFSENPLSFPGISQIGPFPFETGRKTRV